MSASVATGAFVPRQNMAAPTASTSTAAAANVPYIHGDGGRADRWNSATNSDRSRTSSAQAGHCRQMRRNLGTPFPVQVAIDERLDLGLRDVIVFADAEPFLQRR